MASAPKRATIRCSRCACGRGCPAPATTSGAPAHQSPSAQRRERLHALVTFAFEHSDGTYGYRRVHAQLSRWGHHFDDETVRRCGAMRCDAMRCVSWAWWPVSRVSRKVVGYAMADHMRAELVTQALDPATCSSPPGSPSSTATAEANTALMTTSSCVPGWACASAPGQGRRDSTRHRGSPRAPDCHSQRPQRRLGRPGAKIRGAPSMQSAKPATRTAAPELLLASIAADGCG